MSSTWTREKAERLSEMVRSKKYSRAQIARKLGVTRNSICGKITRDGIGGPNEKLVHNENVVHSQGERVDINSWDRAVFEPWSVFRARRMAERRKVREMCDA